MKSFAFALTILTLALHGQAHAQACAELGDNIIYGIGSAAQTPLIGQIASRLRDPEDEAAQLTIVYADPGGCYAFAAFDTTKTEAQRRISATPSGTTARYWNQGSTAAQTCVLDEEVLADFSVAQHDESFCTGIGELPAALGDFKGPVGTFNVIVPDASSERSISAEAIYFLLKFGAAAEVAPWTDERYIVLLPPASLVQQSIAKAVGFSGEIEHGYLGASAPLGVVAASGVHVAMDDVAAVIEPNADATIGFANGENADAARDKVRSLAYQHFDQECAYWPDSSQTASDKLNVRTGRYALWSSLHVRALVGEDDVAVNDDVARLIGYITNPAVTPAELPLLDIYIDGYSVPQCAMQVARDEELGALSSYAPEEPCGCYFDFRATGRSSCAECSDDGDCTSASPTCRLGYCERQ